MNITTKKRVAPQLTKVLLTDSAASEITRFLLDKTEQLEPASTRDQVTSDSKQMSPEKGDNSAITKPEEEPRTEEPDSTQDQTGLDTKQMSSKKDDIPDTTKSEEEPKPEEPASTQDQTGPDTKQAPPEEDNANIAIKPKEKPKSEEPAFTRDQVDSNTKQASSKEDSTAATSKPEVRPEPELARSSTKPKNPEHDKATNKNQAPKVAQANKALKIRKEDRTKPGKFWNKVIDPTLL